MSYEFGTEAGKYERGGGQEAGMLREGKVPFFIAFAFSALRAACAGLTDFSLGILEGCEEM